MDMKAREFRLWKTRHGNAYLLTIVISLLTCPTFASDSDRHIGRLFFSPEYRASLDRQRQLNINESRQAPGMDDRITINGVVVRSSGKRTVWLNGVPRSENETAGPVSVTPQQRSPGDVIVEISGAPSATARVGETVTRHTRDADSSAERQIAGRSSPGK